MSAPMTAREELAAVLLEQLNTEYGDEGWTELGSLRRITDALLASPALARVIREAKAEAWEEAYKAGADDGHDHARGLAAGRGNPYRDQTEEPT